MKTRFRIRWTTGPWLGLLVVLGLLAVTRPLSAQQEAVTPEGADPVLAGYSPDTWFKVYEETFRPSAKGKVKARSFYEDFTEVTSEDGSVSGIFLPAKTVMFAPSGMREFLIETFEANPQLDDTIFAVPTPETARARVPFQEPEEVTERPSRDSRPTVSKKKIMTISRGEEVDLERYLVPGKYTVFEFYADW